MKYLYIILIVIGFTNCQNDKIINKLKHKKNIVIQNQKIAKLDITKLNHHILSKSLQTIHIYSDIIFINCTFTDTVKTFVLTKNYTIYTEFHGNVVFENCIFEKPVIFKQAQFYGQTKFFSDTFKAPVIFEGAAFLGSKNNFSQTVFNDVKFSSAKFWGEVNFFNTKFNSANFTKVKFNDLANFSATEFEKFLIIYDIRAYDFLFNYVKLHGKTDIKNNYFFSRCEFIKFSSDTSITFKNNYFYGKTKIINPQIKGKLILKNNFFGSDTTIRITNTAIIN